MNGEVTRALINCLNNGELDSAKFFSKYPMTESLKRALIDLERKGYIALDYGDDSIQTVAAKKKLIDLVENDNAETPG